MRIKTETAVGLFILAAIIIFLYMTFQIGVLRLDTARYSKYTVYFHDISGLSKKADVQIAGVKVGWVEDVELVNNGQQVRASAMILKTYTLYNDAYGVIRQDGLLGTKYLEIIPGDPLLPTIKAGGILMKPSKDPVAVDEILSEFQDIARNLNDVTNSFREVLGGDVGTQRLENAIEGFNKATENIASFSRAIDGVIERNEQSFSGIMDDLNTFSNDLKNEFPGLSHDIRDGINRASNSIDRDLNRFATQFEKTAEPIGKVADDISNGKGVLGKLVNDEDTAHDIQEAIEGVRNYFRAIDRLAIVFDAHVESMYGLGNRLDFEDAKGYFNVRIHPTEDYFYLLGLMGSFSGRIKRDEEFTRWFDNNDCEIKPENIELSDRDKLRFAPRKEVETREFDQYLLNAQFGKIYQDLAIRGGLIDGAFGIGVDYDIPFNDDTFHWVTSFEAYDFYGRNRIGDTRAHLKWINKVTFANGLYTVFGADDFISETNKNAFFGFGVRFSDDDVKYIASKASFGG